MIVIMAILKSEEEFLEQLKKWRASGTVPPELVKFLEEVYASKLYYQYYSRFVGSHYRAVIDQFTKLSQNPKATKKQLASALELSCADIHELFIQLEDCKQDQDYQDSIEDEVVYNDIRPLNLLIVLNIIITLVLTACVVFK